MLLAIAFRVFSCSASHSVTPPRERRIALGLPIWIMYDFIGHWRCDGDLCLRRGGCDRVIGDLLNTERLHFQLGKVVHWIEIPDFLECLIFALPLMWIRKQHYSQWY